MINRESIAEMQRMNQQLDTLETRLAKLFVKVNKYLKMNKDNTRSSKGRRSKIDKK